MLALRDAGRRFGARRVFSGLDLDVPAGTRLLVVGGNGSGKTTLLRCLSGTLALTAGRGTVCGLRIGSQAARRLVGVCLATEHALYDTLPAHDNLMLVARLRLPSHRVADAVAQVEQELDVEGFAGLPVQRCSAGMRARVTIARALLGDPAILLLDEPSRSLDDSAHGLLWAALDRRPDVACVVASHHAGDRTRCHRTLALPVRR
jgi:ABC-type multidrug transport system ATPase subunit